MCCRLLRLPDLNLKSFYTMRFLRQFTAWISVTLLLSTCSRAEDEHHKRVPSGFTGVRGKKSIPDDAYNSEDLENSNSIQQQVCNKFEPLYWDLLRFNMYFFVADRRRILPWNRNSFVNKLRFGETCSFRILRNEREETMELSLV